MATKSISPAENPLAFWQKKVGDVITGFRTSMNLEEISEEENNNTPDFVAQFYVEPSDYETVDPRDLPSKIPVRVRTPDSEDRTPSPHSDEDGEEWNQQPHVAPGWNISTKFRPKKASELPVPTRKKPLLRSQSEFALKIPLAPPPTVTPGQLHRRSSTTPSGRQAEGVRSARRGSMPVKATVNYQNCAALAGGSETSPRSDASSEKRAYTRSNSVQQDRRTSTASIGETSSGNRRIYARSNSAERTSPATRRASTGESPRRSASPAAGSNRPASPGAAKKLPANHKMMNGEQPVNFRRQSSESSTTTAARRQMRMQRSMSVNLDVLQGASPRSEEESPSTSPGRRNSLQKVKYIGPPTKDRWESAVQSAARKESSSGPISSSGPTTQIPNVRMRTKVNPNARDANRRASNAF